MYDLGSQSEMIAYIYSMVLGQDIAILNQILRLGSCGIQHSVVYSFCVTQSTGVGSLIRRQQCSEVELLRDHEVSDFRNGLFHL